MNAQQFITPAKAKQIAKNLEINNYQLEINNGAIDCPTVDASTLHSRFKSITDGEYLCNIIADFCLANGLSENVVAVSLR